MDSICYYLSKEKKNRPARDICSEQGGLFTSKIQLTFAVEGCTLGILTAAGVVSAYAHLICHTFTCMIIGTFFCITGNLGGLAGNAVRIAGPVVFALAETLAAGLIYYLRVFSTYMDIVLAAGIILIVGTVYNRTV